MSDSLRETIGVIGAGIMGQTLIKGMLDAGLVNADRLWAAVNTKTSAARVHEVCGVATAVGFFTEQIQNTDVFLVCTKPYKVAEILGKLRESDAIKPGAVVISIAAGTTLATMEQLLPGVAVIRAMPNTPCRIRAGATVLSPGTHAETHHMARAQAIFRSVGICLQLDEHHLNAVTAVSGSGPAYAYLIMEALADGAVKVGLPRQVAFELVAQTMLGSAQMLQQTGRHPAMLKDEVTTPSGCTIAALLALEDGRIRSTLARAVEAATQTAADLG